MSVIINSDIEVSIVIPCLNEEETVAVCIAKGLESFAKGAMSGEVIVVDNGSTDKTVEFAINAGARVVHESLKGYGSALRAGIEAARGKYIVMADGDDTYDFSEAYKFIHKLKEGFDLVMGSRFKGNILPGAMTWSHRYIGNPILSGILRIFFGGTVSDSHCGLRAFTKEAYKKMKLRTAGMEFASEMVIHAIKIKMRISEIPITYYPRKGLSKLSSFRDAWRHMRFMLLYSPNYLFLFPGLVMFIIGFGVTIRFLFGSVVFLGRQWDIHVMVFSCIMAILGWEILNLGFSAKAYAHKVGIEDEGLTKRLLRIMSLERTLLLGGIFLLAGIALSTYIVVVWALSGFGELSQVKTGLSSLMLTAMGIQTIFSGFLMSMLQVESLKIRE